jgi:hypothetical protein
LSHNAIDGSVEGLHDQSLNRIENGSAPDQHTGLRKRSIGRLSYDTSEERPQIRLPPA